MIMFTYMSAEAVTAVKDAIPGNGYDMHLSPAEMRRLVDALAAAYDMGGCEWAGDLVSSVGQTVGVEFV